MREEDMGWVRGCGRKGRGRGRGEAARFEFGDLDDGDSLSLSEAGNELWEIIHWVSTARGAKTDRVGGREVEGRGKFRKGGIERWIESKKAKAGLVLEKEGGREGGGGYSKGWTRAGYLGMRLRGGEEEGLYMRNKRKEGEITSRRGRRG